LGRREFRTSPKFEREEAQVLAHLAITAETQREIYEKLMEILSGNLANGNAITAISHNIDCIHFVPVPQKKGKMKYYCHWRKEKTAPTTKTISEIELCHSCVKQEKASEIYKKYLEKLVKIETEPADTTEKQIQTTPITAPTQHTIKETAKPKPKIIVVDRRVSIGDITFDIVENWDANTKTDGARMCPFSGDLVFTTKECVECKKTSPQMYDACFQARWQAQKKVGLVPKLSQIDS
jgi:hypothetical protein